MVVIGTTVTLFGVHKLFWHHLSQVNITISSAIALLIILRQTILSQLLAKSDLEKSTGVEGGQEALKMEQNVAPREMLVCINLQNVFFFFSGS